MKLAKAYVYFVFYFPIVVLFFICLFFGLYVLANHAEDTTRISNSAFGILAIFSGLCFSFARNLNQYEPVRDRILFSGEQFLISSIYMIMASIIKYASLKLSSIDVDGGYLFIIIFSNKLFVLIYVMLFFMALLSAHSGLRILNIELRKRYYRHDDWDDLF